MTATDRSPTAGSGAWEVIEGLRAENRGLHRLVRKLSWAIALLLVGGTFTWIALLLKMRGTSA